MFDFKKGVLGVHQKPEEKPTEGSFLQSGWADVLILQRGEVTAVRASWGLENPYRKGSIREARGEKAARQPLFKPLLWGRRCLVLTGEGALAGLFSPGEESPAFLLLTRPGGGYFPAGEDWLKDPLTAQALLSPSPERRRPPCRSAGM